MVDTSGKARVHAALEGRRVDRFPVAALYSHYYQADHFAELTGMPSWKLHWWRHATPKARLQLDLGFGVVDLMDPVRRDDEISRGGIEIHWPYLDEDLSVAGLMAGEDWQSA